jgi:rfaE bifunctional protein kinase chain/domain
MKHNLDILGKGRIGVIGDFCLDVYWHADMTKSELSRETPHFPLPIVQERLSPGGAGNVVANLLALKPKKVNAIGVFGADWRGAALKDLLKKGGADVSGVVTDPDRVTNTYIKPLRKGYADNVVYEDPRLDFTNYEPLAAVTEKKLLALLDRLAKKVDVLCVCDQMPCGCITEAVRERICALGESGLTVIVDSRDRIGLYSDVIVKPNEIEASRVFKGKVKATDFEQLANLMEVRTGRPAIVTAGEKGCYVSTNGQVAHVPACKVTGEIDFCGAGDTFLSALATATAGGFSLVDAATLACAASAVTIKKLRTTGTANRAELRTRLESDEVSAK